MSKQIWFTSDTHYHHKNIVSGTTSWEGGLDKCRNFKTLEEHDNTIVDNINQVVKEDDELYHLGDWSFGGHEQIKIFRERIKCKNIHLIFGNHDQHIEPIDSPYRKLFASVQYYKELSLKVDPKKTKFFGKHKIILCHYAMRVWNKSHHGSIMLYGHSHGTLDEMQPKTANPTWIGDQYFIKNYRTMDVGVDTNNLYPYNLEQILEIMYNRDVLLEIDHHNEKTN